MDPAQLYVTLRTRLRCQVWASPACEKPAIKHCLNEVVIDKGAHPGLGTLDCHVDGMHVTTVQADGLVISTPSGSTGTFALVKPLDNGAGRGTGASCAPAWTAASTLRGRRWRTSWR